VAPSVQRRKVWLTLTTLLLLKFGGVPQTGQPISAASRPKFTILWGHMEDILLINKFFPIVDMCLRREDVARQSCAMVPSWRFLATFLRPVFSASRVQQVSDLHLKFALRATPCVEVWQTSNLRRLRLGEEKRRRRRRRRRKNKSQHENIMVCPIP